jgi:hypothetical protein
MIIMVIKEPIRAKSLTTVLIRGTNKTSGPT